jgi:hypothetical protein
MKEKDIRDHINAFLRTKLQSLVVPASMGLGMMMAGCSDSPLSGNPDGSGDVQPGGSGGFGTLYGIGGSFRGGAGGSVPPGLGGAGGTAYGAGGRSYGGSGGSQPPGLGGAGGTVYGIGGSYRGGAGGTIPGVGGVYGIGAMWGGGGGSGGAGGGMGGIGGTIYGTGGAKDAAPSDTREIETGPSPDTQTSEAGAVEPKDALPGGPEIL